MPSSIGISCLECQEGMKDNQHLIKLTNELIRKSIVHILHCRFLNMVCSSTHPGGIQSPGIQGLWGSIVVNDGHAIGVSHCAEDGQLRLRDGLGGHQVGPEHRLVACWSCQASLWLGGRS